MATVENLDMYDEGDPPLPWSTCMSTMGHDGMIHVCLKSRTHTETEEPGSRIHIDHNTGLVWMSASNVWYINQEIPASWRDWFQVGSLDRRSVAWGVAATLLVAAILIPAVLGMTIWR